jgi:hypothetical protein
MFAFIIGSTIGSPIGSSIISTIRLRLILLETINGRADHDDSE